MSSIVVFRRKHRCWSSPLQHFLYFLYTCAMQKKSTLSTLQELQKLVSRCTATILYKPIKNEVDYNDSSFPLEIPKNSLILSNDKNSDPFKWADDCIDKFKNLKTCILIPGTQFDIYGTRHGKGAGWYDRFLSRIPSAWLRIGIIDKAGMSHSKILKQKWDESVDWIIVYNGFSWSIYNARNNL